MALFKKRLQARELRKNGASIKSIARNLEVSSASVSTWCRDLVLTPEQKYTLTQNAIRAGYTGRMKGAQTNREKKEQLMTLYRESGKQDLATLSSRDRLLAFTALYWAEGTKGDSNRFCFTNSDPRMIHFLVTCLRQLFDIKNHDFLPRIHINEMHRQRTDVVLDFWVKLLDVQKEQFRKTTFIKVKTKKVYDNYDSYYGVLQLRLRKSVHIKYKTLGLIEALRDTCYIS